MRGFVSMAMNGDSEKAGTEIEAHLAAGGNFDEIMKEIEKAVQTSGFFRALQQSQKTGNPASKSKTTTKSKAE